MRVVVLGVGAIGGWLAAGLARGGAEVAILARGATLAALRAEGLTLLHGDAAETFPLRATDDPAALAAPDILLIGLKGQDIPALLPAIRALLGPRTLVVPALNGIPWWFTQGLGGPADGAVLDSVDPGGAVGRAVPVSRVIGCVVHAASLVAAPGRIRLVKADRLPLGDPSGANAARLAELVAAFRAGGVPAEAAADIRFEVWSKLWGNATMNPLSALCRADMAQMLDDPATRGLVVTMMEEMAALGARLGLPPLGAPEARMAVARRLGAFRTSMLQDLEAGRALELGPILGGLVELAERAGIAVPTLSGINGLTRLLARNLKLGA